MPERTRLFSAPHRILEDYLGSWHTGSSSSLWLLAQQGFLPCSAHFPLAFLFTLHPQFPAAQLPESNLFYQVFKHPLRFHFLDCWESNPFKLWACQASVAPQSHISESLQIAFFTVVTFIQCVVCLRVCTPQCIHEGQRTRCRVQFSLSTTWTLGRKLRLAGLVASALTHPAFSWLSLKDHF